MMKQSRIEVDQARKGLEVFKRIPLQYVRVNTENVVDIGYRLNTYAYDAYFLDCSARHNAPLLTLDLTMKGIAEQLGIELLKVEEDVKWKSIHIQRLGKSWRAYWTKRTRSEKY